MRSFVAGRIERVPTSGIRVIFEKASKIPGAIRMEVGEPDFDTPRYIGQAAKKAIDDGATHYTSIAGMPELRQAISDKLKKENGVDADPSTEIAVVPGAGAAIYLSILGTTNPGDEVMIPDPGWTHYEACVRLAGGIPVRYPTLESSDFRPDLEETEKLVSKKTKSILLNTPSNPTGAVLDEKDVKSIADIASSEDLLVISDEVYEKIIYDGAKNHSIASLPGMKQRTVTVNALSKTYAMTGWRLGYAAAPPEVTAQTTKLSLYASGCASSIAQVAAITALSGPQQDVERMQREYSKRRMMIADRLNEMPGVTCHRPAGAFYAFPRFDLGGMNSFDTSMFLLENAKVATVPGSSFGALGENHIRFSFATSVARIEEAMDRIELAIKDSNPKKPANQEKRSRKALKASA
jgi:aminotransferase